MAAFDLTILILSLVAVGFILLGVFYPSISYHLGLDEATPERRLLSVMIGLALFALLFVYRLATQSMAEF